MGRSQTVNCIGQGIEETDSTGGSSSRIYDAMNKMEVSQEIEKAKRRGESIVGWYAQTKTGCKTLGTDHPYDIIKTESIKLPKLIECPICGGVGRKESRSVVQCCFVCDGSGITKNGYWKQWQDWQLNGIRAEFA